MDGAFRLSDMLIRLREDLEAAKIAGGDSMIGLQVGPIELELEVVAGSDTSVEGKASWWVISASGGGTWKDARTQRLKLTLEPRDRTTNDPLEVNRRRAAP